MFKVLLIFLLGTLVTVQCACPEVCECDGHRMTCSAIPADSPPEEVTEVTITELNETGSLAGLQILNSIKFLNLSRLDIVKLDDLVDVNLPNIRTLILSHNRIKKLNENHFTWCPNLEVLDLSDNIIKKISEPTFDVLTELKSLNLSNNDLEEFELASYLNPSIVELDITNNILKQVPTFNQLPQLRRLLLCGNKYQKWPTNVWNSLENLQELCLGNDLIDGVESAGDLAKLGQLRKLTLNLNSNVQVHATLLSELAAMSALNFLTIDSCLMDNLDFLTGLNELQSLTLTKISLSNVSCPFNALKNVTVLNLSGSSDVEAAIISSSALVNTSLNTLIAPSCNITTIPQAILSQIEFVDVSFNPLNCDSAFLKALVGRNVTFYNAKKTICALPVGVSGWKLADVLVSYENGDDYSDVGEDDTKSDNGGGLGDFLDAVGLSREILFYLCIVLVVLIFVSLAFLMFCVKCKCCRKMRFRSSVKKTGWKGRFSGNYDNVNGCTDDFFFPRADNEYTFDNFTVVDTIARSKDNNQTDD